MYFNFKVCVMAVSILLYDLCGRYILQLIISIRYKVVVEAWFLTLTIILTLAVILTLAIWIKFYIVVTWCLKARFLIAFSWFLVASMKTDFAVWSSIAVSISSIISIISILECSILFSQWPCVDQTSTETNLNIGIIFWIKLLRSYQQEEEGHWYQLTYLNSILYLYLEVSEILL